MGRNVVICSKFITFAVTKTTSSFKLSSNSCCDLLKIHYLCGDKDNNSLLTQRRTCVVICSKFITFAVTKTTRPKSLFMSWCCDLLKIHYLCGDKDNERKQRDKWYVLWFAQNSLPLRWQRQLLTKYTSTIEVVICSKFITFAVTKTTLVVVCRQAKELWFAQNSLPLRWQRQR